jgi:Coenzyme PQQ synthesis protein D (PqqD)
LSIARNWQSTPPLQTPIVFDGAMLLVAGHERLLAYNESAHQIWCVLSQGGSPADAAAMLSRSFALDPNHAQTEVDAIVDHWQSEGLFEPESERSTIPDVTHRAAPPAPRSWGEQWTCRFGDRLVDFAVEDARRAATFRLPFHLLEVPSRVADARLEIRELGNDVVAVIRDGRERARVSHELGLKDAIHLALIDLIWPDYPVATAIHAAAVARGDVGLCFPAPSGRGKSTLIAHLLANGFEYLADDLTVLDDAGRILPWPLPVSVKKGSWDVLDRQHPELRSSPYFALKHTDVRFLSPPNAWSATPTELRALIFPSYRQSHPPELQRIRPIEALIELREAGIWLGHPLTETKARQFLSMLEATPSYKLVYESLTDATQLIDQLRSTVDV